MRAAANFALQRTLGMLQPCLEPVDDTSVWRSQGCIKGRALSLHQGVQPFFDLSGAQPAELRAFVSDMSATANHCCQRSQLHIEYCAFLVVQPFFELSIACLIKQSVQC